MSLQRVEPFQPLVDGVLSLLGVTVAPVGIVVGLAKLKARSRPLEKFAAMAVERIASLRRTEFAELGDFDREAVETRVTELLGLGLRDGLLTAAILGRDEFATAMMPDRAVAVKGLGDDAVGYLHVLIGTVHGLVDEFAREPELYPAASESALRIIAGAVALRPTTAQVVQMLDDLRAELVRRPQQIVAGNRPRLATHFVDRDEMSRLEEALSSGGVAMVSALQGMRGVGKSQLASAFAEYCEASDWMFVGWVAAPTKQQAIEELALIARGAGLVPGDVSLEEAALRLVSWLSDGSLSDRLLVFDNVEDADDLAGLVPRGQGMRVIVTTTSHAASVGIPVEVGVFSMPQAVAFLTESTGLVDEAGALALAADLGRLPVALTQAASTIRLLGVDFGEYRTLLADHSMEDTLRREAGDSYPVNVGRALRLAYQIHLRHLTESDPVQAEAARKILGALSVLAESGTPKPWLRILADSPLTAARAVGGLVQRSLVMPDADGHKVSVHRLQARVIRENAAGTNAVEEHHQAAAAVLAGIDVDSAGGYWAQRTMTDEASVALVEILAQAPSQQLTTDPAVLDAAARVIHHSSRLGIPHLGIALSTYVGLQERVQGADHPNTLASRAILASAYESVGDLARAVPLHQQTLTDTERALGADHPNTLAVRNNLANAYKSAGNLVRAIPLHQKTVTDTERVLGIDHPDTLTSRHNLAHAYQTAGDLARAIPLFEQTLTDRERVLGADHPDTLTSRHNLADAYQSAGELARAIRLFGQTLIDRERVLGADHPDTLTSRSDLARAYEFVGDLTRAIPLFEQTLADRERILSTDHPQTLTSRNNLAHAYQTAGDLTRAIPLFEQTVADEDRVHGPLHPHTLSSRNNLAYAYKAVGDLTRAIPLFEQTLTDQERVLGSGHPDTLASRNNLAIAYQTAGDLTRAIPLLEQTLTDQERLKGPNHPHTLTSRNNLANAYWDSGQREQAFREFERAAGLAERLFGPTHEVTRLLAANTSTARILLAEDGASH